MSTEEITTLCRTDQLKSEFGIIRLEEWPEGLILWVGGEVRWRSWRDPNLWNVRPTK